MAQAKLLRQNSGSSRYPLKINDNAKFEIIKSYGRERH